MATVVTLGNPHRGDDGVGPWIAERLRDRGVSPLEVEDPTRLVDLAETDLLVVVDAVISGAPVGAVLVLDVTDRPLPTEVTTSSHTISLGQGLALLQRVGTWPRRVLVVGVEIEEIHPEPGLHAEVEVAAGHAVEVVVGLLRGPGR
ncbi:MAG: hydrogenase maturation protease [Acidimicrobiia bacterium]|nr:hydrogenase maturation protease [Acidimicrobiia bacterium]